MPLTYTGCCQYVLVVYVPSLGFTTGGGWFYVYVEDRNEPGTGADHFWIEVIGGLSILHEAADNALDLGGGNLVVPHRAK